MDSFSLWGIVFPSQPGSSLSSQHYCFHHLNLRLIVVLVCPISDILLHPDGFSHSFVHCHDLPRSCLAGFIGSFSSPCQSSVHAGQRVFFLAGGLVLGLMAVVNRKSYPLGNLLVLLAPLVLKLLKIDNLANLVAFHFWLCFHLGSSYIWLDAAGL